MFKYSIHYRSCFAFKSLDAWNKKLVKITKLNQTTYNGRLYIYNI